MCVLACPGAAVGCNAFPFLRNIRLPNFFPSHIPTHTSGLVHFHSFPRQATTACNTQQYVVMLPVLRSLRIALLSPPLEAVVIAARGASRTDAKK